MDLKKKRWVFALGAIGFTVYGVYRALNSSFMVKNKQRMSKFAAAFDSLVEAVSDSSEGIGILSKDLKDFLGSDSDQVPRSLKQLHKLTNSGEFHRSIAGITTAVTTGVYRGFCNESATRNSKTIPGFGDRLIDGLFSEQGSGFASMIVETFSRNLVIALYSEWSRRRSESKLNWVEIICEDNCRELIGDLIRALVSTAVMVYLDKTKHINAFDDLFSGMTNLNHEAKVRQILASLCTTAITAYMKTSNSVSRSLSFEDNSIGCMISKSKIRNKGRMIGSILAIPTNRKLVVDMTGTAMFETVRSFLEFMNQKVSYSMRMGMEGTRRDMKDRSDEAMRYAMEKTSSMVSLCLNLCLYILDSPWSFQPR